MANVVTYPAKVVAVANLVKVIQDSASPELVIGWMGKDGAAKSVTLTRQPFNRETEFSIEGLLRELFGDFQGGDITVLGHVAGTFPSELSGEYTINGIDGFVVAMAALRKGEASDNNLLTLGKKFLTERPASGDGSIIIPVYEGYPSGVCVRDYSPDVSIEVEYPYILQRECLFDGEGYESHGALRLYIDCPADASWSLSGPTVGDATPAFSQNEGTGPATVLYWAEIPNVGEEEGYYVDPETVFQINCSFSDYGITKTISVQSLGEPLQIRGNIVPGGNMALTADGEYPCPFRLTTGEALIWGEASGLVEDVLPVSVLAGDTTPFPINGLPSSGESVVRFYAAAFPGAVFAPVSSVFTTEDVFNLEHDVSVEWGAAVFSTAADLFLRWALVVKLSVGVFGKGFSKVTDFSYAFPLAPRTRGVTLATIPTGLFDNCVEATDFDSCFVDQDQVPVIPTGLFDNCRKATNFGGTFYNCASLTGETPYTVLDSGEKVKLWERGDYPEEFASVDNWADCFRGCTDLDDYSEIPNTWK